MLWYFQSEKVMSSSSTETPKRGGLRSRHDIGGLARTSRRRGVQSHRLRGMARICCHTPFFVAV